MRRRTIVCPRSASLHEREPSNGVSSAVLAEPSPQSGGWFTSRTWIVTVAMFEVAWPSLAENVKVSSPEKPAAGV
jgi:hypothetical protein